jgi:hypothetical protein
MTGSQYAALYRRSIEDLHPLAEAVSDAARKILSRPPLAEQHLRRAEQTTNPAERRRLYIAVFRDAHAEVAPVAGNDWLSDLIEINLPKDVKNDIEALKASYDIVNQTAKGRSDWDTHYQEFLRFYEQNKDPGWLNTSQSTVNNIRARAKRLEEWKQKLAAEGVAILEPEKKPDAAKNPVKDTIDSATLFIGLGLGGLLLWKLAK